MNIFREASRVRATYSHPLHHPPARPRPRAIPYRCDEDTSHLRNQVLPFHRGVGRVNTAASRQCGVIERHGRVPEGRAPVPGLSIQPPSSAPCKFTRRKQKTGGINPSAVRAATLLKSQGTPFAPPHQALSPRVSKQVDEQRGWMASPWQLVADAGCISKFRVSSESRQAPQQACSGWIAAVVGRK